MSEVLLSNFVQPPNSFEDAPLIIIYDPGQHILNPIKQLHPYGSIVNIHHDVNDLINIIENSQDQQLFLLLIFPNKDDVAVKQFLTEHIPNSAHLFSLFLIFSNGIQCHERWINDKTIPKLRWCRSFTNRLIRNILDVCKSACDQSITFYEQRQIQAEDAIENESINGAESLAILFAGKVKEYAILLSVHLSTYTGSDNSFFLVITNSA